MELTDLELEQLENYYQGKLPPEQLLALKQRIQKEKDYGAAAQDFLFGLEVLERGRLRTHRAYLSTQEPVMKASWVRRWGWMAVAGLVGIVLSVMLLKGGGETDPIVAFALREFEPYPSVYKDMQSTQKNGMELYALKEYKQAKGALKSEFETEIPRDSTKLFYLSMCYLADKDPKNAISILEAIKFTKYAPLETPWYLALAYLLSGDQERAKPLLESTAQGSTIHKTKAAEALRILQQNAQ